MLKTYLAFQRYTQKDWIGRKANVDAFLAGIDQYMPGVATAGRD
jgi:hypothetical protein